MLNMMSDRGTAGWALTEVEITGRMQVPVPARPRKVQTRAVAREL